MYRVTQDRHDHQRRVANHSTKGSARGTVWWNAPGRVRSPEEKRLAGRLLEVVRSKKSTKEQRRQARCMLRAMRRLDEEAAAL